MSIYARSGRLGRLVEQLPRTAHISGSFDQVPDNMTSVEFEVDTEPEADVEDQTSYLSKLAIESSYEKMGAKHGRRVLR